VIEGEQEREQPPTRVFPLRVPLERSDPEGNPLWRTRSRVAANPLFVVVLSRREVAWSAALFAARVSTVCQLHKVSQSVSNPTV
jgi:hypothetical protein